jgi:uncharacterized protein (TIGR02996 family)
MLEGDFIAAIRAAPGDDEPRLAYANWLLERGDGRGELIAVQCQLAARAGARGRRRRRGEPTVRELRASERRLLAHAEGIRPDWAFAWPPRFVRGFASKIVVRDAATLFAHEAEIRGEHPLATLALADGSEMVISADRSRYAVLTTTKTGAGCTLDVGTEWTTTTVTVFDRDGRELHTESSKSEHAYTSSSDWESGEDIEAIALSENGRALTLTMSLSGKVTRAL